MTTFEMPWMKSMNEETANVIAGYLAQQAEEINKMVQPMVEEVLASFYKDMQVGVVDIESPRGRRNS